ncbi:MAG: MraY family glycosyltransferase [Pseudomonadota bacterium]
MTDFMIALVALAATVAAIIPLRHFADRLGLVDVPTQRKRHRGAVPVIGGIAMVLGITAAVGVSGHFHDVFWLGASAYLLLLCGMIDDKFSIRVALRLLVQCMVALILLLGTGIELSSVGALLPGVDVELGRLALPFTVFCIIGVVNAVNMIDGVDGLSGTLMLVTFAGLAAISFGHGGGLFVVSLAVSFALVGFLLFNARAFRSRAAIFMGDAGSTTLGLIVAFLLISLSQAPQASVSPVGAAWILGVPLLDAMTVIVKRAVSGRPVFGADRAHVHHVFLDLGYSVNATVIRLAALQAILVGVGFLISSNRQFETLGFWGFIALIAASVGVSTLVVRRRKRAEHRVNRASQH